MIHDVARWLGLTNASGGWYLWWSGMFGDLTIFGAVILVWWHHLCHTGRCWRIARHDVTGPSGQHFRVCHRHHAQLHDLPRRTTFETIDRLHRQARAR